MNPIIVPTNHKATPKGARGMELRRCAMVRSVVASVTSDDAGFAKVI